MADPTTLPEDEKRGGEEILIVMKMICATTYLNKLVLAMIYTTVRFFYRNIQTHNCTKYDAIIILVLSYSFILTYLKYLNTYTHDQAEGEWGITMC